MSRNFFRVILAVIVLLNFSEAFSQDYAETALLFSRTRPAGSARIQALGGTQTALGGDYSSGLSNPAGLGMFNKSEFTFSAGLSSHTTQANYLGNESDDNRTVFNIPGVSFVWHMPKDNGAFLGGSFAVSLSRINDFNRATTYNGKNDENSIADYFIDQAFGNTTAQFDEGAMNYNTPTGLGYFNYLIGPKSITDPQLPDDEYFTDADYPDNQQEEILVKGASNQWTFSYGANIQDKFFFGAGVGIASIRYKSQKIFSETFNEGPLEYLQLNENFDVRGSGVNATLGAIARPLDFLQIGISYASPTFYSFTETYEASMGTQWDNFDYYGDGNNNDNSPFLNDEQASTDIVTSDYNLTTPSKLSAGVAFLSKFGFLSGDIELTNPSNAKYSSDTPGISYTSENEDVKERYKPVVNYRLGAEFRYEIYRFRLGYGVQSNTYRGSIDADNAITTFSGGAGIRTKTFYIDFALVNSSSGRYFYQPYTFYDGSGPAVDLKNKTTTGMITVGFPF
jgi:hypothetical protein